ncbi:ABC transporter permease [Clostridiales bacterium AHG0011]|nr:ABC transporter permease [Clostridium sp.]MBS5630131.1 ABC transporter permease [Clostridiales bacterium]MBS6853536.1 ABC transporter permease [Clostridiales bacterium]MCC3396704.1 ABC transporter permease [Clostridiales bacterium AHG0011]RGC64848.1 ABC transporter permease [Dorea longicatena]
MMKMDNDFAKLQRETRKRNRKQAMGIFFGRGIIVKLCTVVVVGFIFMAVFADWITPYDPAAQNLVEKLQTPSASHWLGTDFLGRDVLSRVIYGGRVSMYVSLLSGSFAAVIGIGLGLVAGYVTGIVRRVIMGMTDIILSIPGMVFTLIIAAIMGTGVMSLTLAIGIGMIPTYIRMVNGLVLSLKENDYIVASKLVGRSESKILLKHLLPNAFPSLIVLYTINLGNAIMTESSLSYLGVGINPPTATWGNMVSDAYAYLLQAPWLAMIPGICIIILIISFNVVGDGLRDALDPRLRGKL